MDDYSPVEDNPKLVRDNYSKAIINTDSEAYDAYMKRKKKAIEKENELQNLKKEVSEIKDLLIQIAKKVG